MKRVAFILTLALTVACAGEKKNATPHSDTFSMSLNISISDLSAKTAYTADGGALKCSWSAGDSVSVISVKDGKVQCVDRFVTAAGGRTATFEGKYFGKNADAVICLYPPLKGTQALGYSSRRLPGAADPTFRLAIGDDCLTFAGSTKVSFVQSADADVSHIAWTDVMTGAVDLAHPESGVTMTKHSDVLAVSASIPDLGSNERVREMTLSLSVGSPFAFGAATLALPASGLWQASSASSSTTLKFGTAGFMTDAHAVTAYIPVLPLQGASALQGDQEREITISVITDKAQYSAVKAIPAHSAGDYAYPLTGGHIDHITATLEAGSIPPQPVVTTTGICDPDKGWVFFDAGPYTLNTTVDPSVVPAGSASFQLVRDLSLQGGMTVDVVLSTTTTIGANGELNVPLGNLEPGFYQVRIRNDQHRFFIGVRPDDVLSPVDKKADFDSFWESTFAEVDAMPFTDVTWTPVPDNTNSVRACYEVRYTSWGGVTGGGVISIPVAAGKYPVRMQFLGYGNDASYRNPNERPTTIDFQVSTRDQGLFKNGSKWDTQGLESKESYYYRGAYCDIKRAINFVMTQLDKADVNRVGVWGSSQGGAFCTMAAAMDSRIKALATTAPFLTDFPDYYKCSVFPMNNDIFPAADAAGIPRSQVLDMLSYFDIKNFAPRIQCPVLLVVGLQDVTCPPHINFAMYNNLGTSTKQFVILPDNIHNEWSNPITGTRVGAFFSQYL